MEIEKIGKWPGMEYNVFHFWQGPHDDLQVLVPGYNHVSAKVIHMWCWRQSPYGHSWTGLIRKNGWSSISGLLSSLHGHNNNNWEQLLSYSLSNHCNRSQASDCPTVSFEKGHDCLQWWAPLKVGCCWWLLPFAGVLITAPPWRPVNQAGREVLISHLEVQRISGSPILGCCSSHRRPLFPPTHSETAGRSGQPASAWTSAWEEKWCQMKIAYCFF